MQVNPSGTYQQTARTAPNASAKPAGDRAGGAAPVEDTGAFIPTSDLTNLVALARSAPEVRAEVVQAAAARLAAGELSTPEAAADTARAFLADRD